MRNNNSKNYKFRGGDRMGAWANSWPFGTLMVNQNALVLRDVMLKKEIKFLKEDIERIEILKLFCIKHGIRIHSKNKSQNDTFCFWYLPHRFKKLFNTLKNCNYL